MTEETETTGGIHMTQSVEDLESRYQVLSGKVVSLESIKQERDELRSKVELMEQHLKHMEDELKEGQRLLKDNHADFEKIEQENLKLITEQQEQVATFRGELEKEKSRSGELVARLHAAEGEMDVLQHQVKGVGQIREGLRNIGFDTPIPEQTRESREELVEEIVGKVLQRVPAGGEVKYIPVEPKMALRKSFQEEEKKRLLEAWGKCTKDQKSIVRFLVAVGKRIGTPEMAQQVFGLSRGSFTNSKWAKSWREERVDPLDAAGFIKHDGNKGQVSYDLRNTVAKNLAYLEASQEDVQAIIEHLEYEIAKLDAPVTE